jgi:hypothetical protein
VPNAEDLRGIPDLSFADTRQIVARTNVAGLPRSPRVAQTTPISTPAAAYLAIVPPAMNVSSSGGANRKSKPAMVPVSQAGPCGRLRAPSMTDATK